MGCAISTAQISALSQEVTMPGSADCFGEPITGPEPDQTYFPCDSRTQFSCPNAKDTLLVNGNEDPDGMYEFRCLITYGDYVQRPDGQFAYTPRVFDLDLDCESDSGVIGDPHVKKWDGSWYDWQGECDTVFLHAPDYRRGGGGGGVSAAHDGGGGLDIHIRTKIRYDYSFMESVAVMIGSDILEVFGFGGSIFNGVDNPEYPLTMGDCCNITYSKMSKIQHDFKVDLGEGAKLDLSTFKDMVSLKVSHTDSPTSTEWFGSSSGLMGTFHGSKTVARDGTTILEDPNDFAQEWQVLDSDPKLFQNQDRAPQFPEKCRLPGKHAAEKRRRLGGGGISKEEAAKACAHWKEDEKAYCIADVMATNDLEMASLQF